MNTSAKLVAGHGSPGFEGRNMSANRNGGNVVAS